MVYAHRQSEKVNGKAKTILMHRFLMNFPVRVDHRDGDGLNNQRGNLRAATGSQNNANTRTSPGKSSRYKGVWWCRTSSRWIAAIKIDRKQRRIGAFKEEADAATAYNFRAYELFGDFARFNLPLGATA